MKREFKVTHGPERPKASRHEQYCGPAALSAVSGYTAEEVAAWINDRRGRPDYYQIRGSFWYELERTARSLGFGLKEVPRSEWVPDGKPTTMKHVFENLSAELWNSRLLFTVPGHFMAYHRGEICDNRWNDPVPWRKARPRRRVRRIFRVTDLTAERPNRAPKPKA